MSMKRKRSPLPVVKPEPPRSLTPESKDIKPVISVKRVKLEVVVPTLQEAKRERSQSRRAELSRADFSALSDAQGNAAAQGHSSSRTPQRTSPRPPARIKAERREDSVAQVLTTNPATHSARQTPSVQEARDLARTYGVLAKAKKDKGFDDDAMEELLRNIGNDPFPVTLDAAIRYLQVSRKFMSFFFGCHNQKMFVTEKVKGRRICFLNIVEGHPNGPRIPGFNGLLFMQEPHDGDHSLNGAELIVFSHLGKHRWLQQGIYRATLAPPLSQARWVLQNQSLKMWWANGIKVMNWGHDVRASIILRRDLQREPTVQELHEAYRSEEPFQNVTEQEILEAFDRGEQRLGIYALKCIGYDEEFQRDIAAKDPEGWDRAYKANKAAGEPAPNTTKGKVAQGKREGKGKGKGKGRAKAEDVTDEEDDGKGIGSVPQGTKSRPRQSRS